MNSNYIANIGLEIHVELKTKTKIFCSCKNSFGDAPNTNVCPICLAYPGVLPAVNKEAIILTIKAGLALGARISPHLLFDRKHYFYPDLPKSHQISQDKLPLCIGGGIKLDSGKYIRFNHIHLEEDAGKLIHDEKTNQTYIDFNRAGVPLIENVTEVDLANGDEAVEFLTKLRQTLIFADVANCKMEQAGMRCDVNISVHKKDTDKYGTKVEMKNLNSFKAVHNAIDFEINRQIEELEKGNKIIQETRKWDDSKEITTSMRKKEESKDYRYMPEPDFISINISPKDVEDILNSMPQSQKDRFEKYVNEYKLPTQHANLLVSEKHIADYFENCLKFYKNPQNIANWIMTDLLKLIKNLNFNELKDIIKEEYLCNILKLLDNKKINRTIAKKLLVLSIKTRQNPLLIAKKEGLLDSLSPRQIASIIKQVLKENPILIKEYSQDKEKITNYIVGQVKLKTSGKADANIIKDYIEKNL